MKRSGIHIKPSHEGRFTAKASRAGMTPKAYARKVLAAAPGLYPASTRRQANFARNAGRWSHKA